jgi:Nuclease-related domain
MNDGRGIAGKGARDLGDCRYASRQKYLPVLLVCGAALIPIILFSLRPGLGIVALLPILIILPALKGIGRRIDRSIKEERRAVRGAKGEELIGSILEELGEDFLVFQDLPSPYGNINHLVLSKRTDLFLIETKAHGGRVNVLNGDLRINQHPPEKDFIAQVVRNTAWLSEQLEAKLSTKVWIEPILVFANAYVERCEPIRNVQIHPATLSAEGSGNLVSVASGCISKAPPTSDFTVAHSKHVSPLGFEWYLGVSGDSLHPAENRDIVAGIDKLPRFER